MDYYSLIKNKIISIANKNIGCHKCGTKCGGTCKLVICETCEKQFYTINKNGTLVCSMGCAISHDK